MAPATLEPEFNLGSNARRDLQDALRQLVADDVELQALGAEMWIGEHPG